MASSQGLVAECPTCKAVVPIDAPECPQCGELFETETPTGSSVALSPAATAEVADDDEGSERKTGFREKFLFYAGIFLILLGGPGIALGSWLHDELRISVGEFTTFERPGGGREGVRSQDRRYRSGRRRTRADRELRGLRPGDEDRGRGQDQDHEGPPAHGVRRSRPRVTLRRCGGAREGPSASRSLRLRASKTVE